MIRLKGLHILLLYTLPFTVISLTCYTCVFPGISPLDCVKVPKDCSAGQRCLYSTATGVLESMTIVLREKRCASPSLCGTSGEMSIAGQKFPYTNKCCDTDFCNAADVSTCWSGSVLIFVVAVFFLLF